MASSKGKIFWTGVMRWPPKQVLTARQRAVFDLIEEAEFPPSYREITKDMGYASVHAIDDVLKALERKKWIRRGPKHMSRTLTVLP